MISLDIFYHYIVGGRSIPNFQIEDAEKSTNFRPDERGWMLLKVTLTFLCSSRTVDIRITIL